MTKPINLPVASHKSHNGKAPSDIEIAQGATLLPIQQVAEEAGLLAEELELYGETKAKVSLSVLDRLEKEELGKYIRLQP